MADLRLLKRGYRKELRERFANENQTWIIWQAITTRQQGPVESLDTYLNDLTSKFCRINISDTDKMRYFVQGLRADLKETVLLKQPKSFQEGEEMARLASTVKTTMNNSNETMAVRLDNSTKTLNTLAAGTSNSTNSAQQQSLQAKMDTLTNILDSLMVSQPKKNKIAAYSKTEKDGQPALMKRTQEPEYHIARLSRQMDARTNEIIYRRQVERINQQRSRDQRPLSHYCGAVGHFPVSCPQRDLHERGPVPRNTLPPPENTERHHYQVATLSESYHDPSYSGQPTEQHPRHAQQVPSQLNSIAVAATDQRETNNGPLLTRRTGIPVGSVPHKRVAYLGAFNTFTRKKYPTRHIDRPKDQMPHAQTCSEQFAGAEEFKEVPTAEQLDPPFYHLMTSSSSQSHCEDEFKETKTADLLGPAPAPAEGMFVDTQYSKSAISGALPPKTEIVGQAWKQVPPVNLMPMDENTEQPTGKVCAFPAQTQQLGIIEHIQELSDKMENLEQHIDAQINKVLRHNQIADTSDYQAKKFKQFVSVAVLPVITSITVLRVPVTIQVPQKSL